MAVLTTTGKQWCVDKMRATNGGAVGSCQAQPNDQMKYIHWGITTTAEAAAQTALIGASAEARVAGTITSPSAALHRVIGTLTSASGQTIAEVGLFDQLATGGTMLIRAMFTGIPLLSGDQIQFTLDFSQT